MFTYLIKNHPLCGCRNDSYIKKITFLIYNVVFQATNIIKKGDFMATKTNRLSNLRGLFTSKYRRKTIYNQYQESIG